MQKYYVKQKKCHCTDNYSDSSFYITDISDEICGTQLNSS